MVDPAPGDRIIAVKTDTTDEWFGLAQTGASHLEKITVAPAPVTLFTNLAPAGVFSWTEVDIQCKRMLVTKFEITASDVELFAIQVYGGPNGTLEQMYAASGFPTNSNSITWPWWYENQNDEEKMYIGIRNLHGTLSSDFTLTVMRGERLG